MADVTDPSGPLDDTLLGAFVDGELDDAAAAQICRRLATDAQAQQRVGQFTAANIALRAAFAAGRATSAALEHVARAEPGGTHERYQPALMRAIRRPRHWVSMAASVLLAFTVAIMWRPWENDVDSAVAATVLRTSALHRWYSEALAARRDLSLDYQADDGNELQAQLNSRWPSGLPVPGLDEYGYRLAGVRLHHDSIDDVTTNIVYRKPPASVLIYAVRRLGPEPAEQRSSIPNVITWTSEDHAHFLAGSEDRAYLHRVAASIRAQVSAPIAVRFPTSADPSS